MDMGYSLNGKKVLILDCCKLKNRRGMIGTIFGLPVNIVLKTDDDINHTPLPVKFGSKDYTGFAVKEVLIFR